MSFCRLLMPVAVIGLSFLSGVTAKPASAHSWGYDQHRYGDHDSFRHDSCRGWYDHYGNFHRECNYRR